MLKDLLRTINDKIKWKTMKNNIIARVSSKARDKVLGMLIGNPGIMTRRYNNYISTEIFKACPYCKNDTGQIIFH